MKKIKFSKKEQDVVNFIHELDRHKAVELICKIDLSYRDMGFSTTLINALLESIKGDLSSDYDKKKLLEVLEWVQKLQ